MAELIYFTGPMDCGKSTLALQLDYTHTAGGRKGRLFTSQDRAGHPRPSRHGSAWPGPPSRCSPAFDFWHYVVDHLTGGDRIDYLVGDEAQFYTAGQVDQLARVVDQLQIDVFAVGILTDFQTRLFPGSQRLVELCDKIEVLQVRSLCWCGNRSHAQRPDRERGDGYRGGPGGGGGHRPPWRAAASCHRWWSRTRCSAVRTTGGG